MDTLNEFDNTLNEFDNTLKEFDNTLKEFDNTLKIDSKIVESISNMIKYQNYQLIELIKKNDSF